MMGHFGNKKRMIVYSSIDRLTGEDIPLVISDFMGVGAKNVNIVPAFGKKGRCVYLCFIDVSEDIVEDVINLLVYKYYTTGWHVVSSDHQYVKMEDRMQSIHFVHGRFTVDLCVPFKYSHSPMGKHLVLMEHDYCEELLGRISSENGNFSVLSIGELKGVLTQLVLKSIEDGSGEIFTRSVPEYISANE